MVELKRPMLAEAAEDDKLKFPLLASPKIDGVRATVQTGRFISRSNKPIPNDHIQRTLAAYGVGENNVFDGYDGELVLGDPTDPDVYNRSQSNIMSHKREFDFTFYVFDLIPVRPGVDGGKTWQRQETLNMHSTSLTFAGRFPDWIKVVKQTLIHNKAELDAYEEEMLNEGFEGVIVRRLDAPYKHGRSTVNQGYMLKIKRFVDSEIKITGFEELEHNVNEAFKNELGQTSRSSAKAGKVGGDTLGALVGVDISNLPGTTVRLGTGFTAEMRQYIWDNRQALLGAVVTYKYFPKGMVDGPRHPVFKGFRDPADMGE